MAFQSLLLQTFGLIFACVGFVLLFKYLYSKLYTLCCSRKSSSITNGALSSNGNLIGNAELSPPPSYDDVVLCSDIFVINIDDGDGQFDLSSRWYDEQLPTYDEASATMGNYPI